MKYLLPILGLCLLPIAQAADGCPQDTNHVNTAVEISQEAFRNILEQLVNFEVPSSLMEFEGDELFTAMGRRASIFGACAGSANLCRECTRQTIRSSLLTETWDKCLGIPILNTVPGDALYNGEFLLKPEPAQFTIDNLKLLDHDLSGIRVLQCVPGVDYWDCTLEVPIHKLSIAMRVNAKSLWRSTSIFNLPDLRISVGDQTANGDYLPKLLIKARLHLHGSIDNLFTVDSSSLDEKFMRAMRLDTVARPDFSAVEGEAAQINAEKTYRNVLAAVEKYRSGDGSSELRAIIKPIFSIVRSVINEKILPEIAKSIDGFLKQIDFVQKPGTYVLTRFNLQESISMSNIEQALLKLGVNPQDCAQHRKQIGSWLKQTQDIAGQLAMTGSIQALSIETDLSSRWKSCAASLAANDKSRGTILRLLAKLSQVGSGIAMRQVTRTDRFSASTVQIQNSRGLLAGVSVCLNDQTNLPEGKLSDFTVGSCPADSDGLSFRVSYDVFNRYLAFLQQQHSLAASQKFGPKILGGKAKVELTKAPEIKREGQRLYLDVSGIKYGASFLAGIIGIHDMDSGKIYFSLVPGTDGHISVNIEGMDTNKSMLEKMLKSHIADINAAIASQGGIPLPLNLKFRTAVPSDSFIEFCNTVQ